ncbi:flagellar biosynthetic protein FliR [Candidatus Paracaedibacter symbiosus]|uniref:flagellar biosynthetic protein FliR n=1 Tax=Candidatus Paracaedibacter symbiosus TaxID=244582 RepID=UPI000509D5B3|nr:flagellar biosynthetic protein FliR [Candidatus Paracaedibacter symbiosus]
MIQTFNMEELLAYFYVFTRLGGVMMLLPGFGEFYIPMRIRLLTAVVMSLAITPVVAGTLPATTLVGAETVYFLVREIAIGFALGAIGRILLNALQISANLIAYQTSLSSATIFNPAMGTQDSPFAPYLIMGATALIFVTNTHYQIIDVFIKSYDAFPPTGGFPFGDFKDMMVRIVSHSFSLGVRLAFPFLIAGLIVNFSGGLLGRLVPQIQVFFVLMPAQVLLGLICVMICVTTIMSVFVQDFFNLYQDLPRG